MAMFVPVQPNQPAPQPPQDITQREPAWGRSGADRRTTAPAGEAPKQAWQACSPSRRLSQANVEPPSKSSGGSGGSGQRSATSTATSSTKPVNIPDSSGRPSTTSPSAPPNTPQTPPPTSSPPAIIPHSPASHQPAIPPKASTNSPVYSSNMPAIPNIKSTTNLPSRPAINPPQHSTTTPTTTSTSPTSHSFSFPAVDLPAPNLVPTDLRPSQTSSAKSSKQASNTNGVPPTTTIPTTTAATSQSPTLAPRGDVSGTSTLLSLFAYICLTFFFFGSFQLRIVPNVVRSYQER